MKPPKLPLLALLIAAGCNKSSGQMLHVPSPAWEEQVVYFIFTDRFNDGDPTNNDQHAGEFDPTNYDKYSGGDLQGIINKLDYIQGLGATAIWITPPVANMWWDPLQNSGGYHGYWARDLKKVDEHLGTLATYKALSDGLHKRGMYLIQDVVPNHMGNFFTYTSYDSRCAADTSAAGCDVTLGFKKNTAATPTAKPTQPPFDQNDATDPAQRAQNIYHWTPPIADYTNLHQQYFYQLSDLDDLNTENPVVRQALRDSYGYWIKEVGVDAFRVDTVKFVPPGDFWNDFFFSTDATAPGMMGVAKATGRNQFHAFGEVLESSPGFDDSADKKLAAYNGTAAKPELPALLAYPLWTEIGRVFGQGRPTATMTYRLQKMMDPSLYPNPNLVPTFLDNHDQVRFLKVGTGDALLQAMTFLFTIPGIPIVYYGTEQGFTETRASMFKGGWKGDIDHFNTNYGMYKIIKALSDMRRGHKVFTHGTLDGLYDNAAGAGPLVYRRQYQGDTAVMFINSSDGNVLVSQMASGLPPGTVLELWHTDSFSKPAPVIGAGGNVDLALPPRAAIVAHATPQIVTPVAPGATITVSTPVDGQTYTQDVTLSGTIAPANAKLLMVIDGYLDSATPVTAGSTGNWSVKLPISTFPLGTQSHTLAFYAPDANVSTPRARFTSNVVFSGKTISVDRPAGDDHGPPGFNFAYPTDSTFNHQQDITNVTFLVGTTTLQIVVTLANMTSVWNPDLGFDHVVFNNYFALPGQSASGTNVMPFLSATTPAGFNWNYGQFSTGWSGDNVMFNTNGASASSFGAPAASAAISSNFSAKQVTFTYDRHNYGLASWNGVQVYVTVWDYDGVNKVFRPITQAGGPFTYGNGNASDPHVMDLCPPVTLSDH
jgi:glycosidase